jgi:hypothetical protein
MSNEKRTSDQLIVTSYLIGGLLFLFGGFRFLIRKDGFGTLIYIVAGVLALFLSYVNYKRNKGKKSE